MPRIFTAEENTLFETAEEKALFEGFITEVGFRDKGLEMMKSRNDKDKTLLESAVLLFQENNPRARDILQICLDLGCDSRLNIPFKDGRIGVNAIGFAAAKGVIPACIQMYQHAKSQGIDILSIYTGDDNQYTPFTLALAQLDNKLPDTSPALEREVSRQEDCAKLIKALVDEGYNPDTVSDRMVPLAIYDSK